MFLNQIFKLDKSYLFFATLRIILTCLPQTGYVHPDEYFQSIEVVAEKTFEVHINKPWEFNATFPVRSVTLPYLTIGAGFQLLKLLNRFFSYYLDVPMTTSYFIVLFPRLLICCLSFLVDWSLYKICSTNSEKFKSRCLVLSISYVMLVYGTRTFSNTMELILFSLLLYFVSDSIIFTTITVKQREYVNKRYYKAQTAVERAKFHKLRLFLQDDTLRNCLIISTISVAGFFNRPTFVAYAVGPIFLWLYRGLGFRSVASLHFHLRTIVFLISTLPTILLFIIIDSFYFGYLTWAEIGVLQVSLDNFVVTPLNFIKYNVNPKNLAQHGLHPRFLHAGVNVPLLFNILAVFGYLNLLDLFSNLIQAKYHYLPTVRSIKGLMTASFVVPVTMLSVFPHQEPRFLIPLMLPLIYLYGAKILPESVGTLAKSYGTNKASAFKKVAKSFKIFKAWIVINVLFTVFYGFIHQGGVYPLISHLSKEVRHSDYNVRYNLVTSHTYSIPESLFYQKLKRYGGPYTYVQLKRLNIHEEGSKNLDFVLSKIAMLLKLCKRTTSSSSKCKLYLAIPNTKVDKLMEHFYKRGDLIWHNAIHFYPHLSTEALPEIPPINLDTFMNFLTQPITNTVRFVKNFGLAHIEFKLNTTEEL